MPTTVRAELGKSQELRMPSGSPTQAARAEGLDSSVAATHTGLAGTGSTPEVREM